MSAAFDLTGKSVLVTGGNGGIGLAMCHALAAAGAKVALWGSNKEKTERATAQLEAAGHSVFALRVDLACGEQIVDGMRRTIEAFGRIDVVIANAAIVGRPSPLLSLVTPDIYAVLAVNVTGAIILMREACRHMVARADAGDPGGSLVLVGSVGSESGMPEFGPYAASKGALAALMRSILIEHARHGIRVNLVQPGFVQTDMTERMRGNPRIEKSVVSRIPMRRWGRPEDFGGVAVYLASDASAYQTGSTIAIDNGFLAI